MGFKKYEVKDAEFPKKEGTDDFGMSAGLFKWLDADHSRLGQVSKATLKAFCDYWLNRHVKDHPDSWKYDPNRLLAIYGDDIKNPSRRLIAPLIISFLVIFGLYLIMNLNIEGEVNEAFSEVPEPEYRCLITSDFKCRDDFLEIAFSYHGSYLKYPVNSGSEYLRKYYKTRKKTGIKFVVDLYKDYVDIDMLDNYDTYKVDYKRRGSKCYLHRDGGYDQFYLAEGVIDGFFSDKVKIKNNYIIWID